MNFNDLSELDKKFKESFGLVGENDKFKSSIDISHFENIANEIDASASAVMDFDDCEYMKGLIDSTAQSYTNLKDMRVARDSHFNYFGKKFTEYVLFNSGLHEPNTMYNIPMTKSHFTDNHGNTVSSKVFVFAEFISEHKDCEIYNDLCESFISLVNSMIYTFDPVTVAILIAILLKSDVGHELGDIFTSDRVKGWFETLINGENVMYVDSVRDSTFSVGIAFLYAMNYTAMDIITNKDDYSSVLAMGTTLIYKNYQKNLVTPYLKNVLYDTFEDEDDEINSTIVNVARKIREDIIAWEKWPEGIDKRPAKPEVFKYIDITDFMEWLYIDTIYRLGNSKEIIDKLDEKIESTQKIVDDSSEDDEKIKQTKDYLEALKARKTKYLTNKSLIAFLFQECTSNEKISDMVFNEEFVAMVISKEPEKDNAMNDSHSCIGSLYLKRDFHPIQSTPINPYYVHFSEGDITSEKANNLAEMLTVLVHPQMKSIHAVSCMRDIICLDNMVETLKTNTFINMRALKKQFDGMVEGFKQVYESVSKEVEFDVGIKSAIDDMFNTFKSTNLDDIKVSIETYLKKQEEYDAEKLKESDKPNEELKYSFYGPIRNILEVVEIMLDVKKRALNIDSQVKEIIKNFNEEFVMYSVNNSRNENKPVINFWPITQQYEYEIKEEIPLTPEEAERTNFSNLKPGDIEHKRYGSRYTVTNPDD